MSIFLSLVMLVVILVLGESPGAALAMGLSICTAAIAIRYVALD